MKQTLITFLATALVACGAEVVSTNLHTNFVFTTKELKDYKAWIKTQQPKVIKPPTLVATTNGVTRGPGFIIAPVGAKLPTNAYSGVTTRFLPDSTKIFVHTQPMVKAANGGFILTLRGEGYIQIHEEAK